MARESSHISVLLHETIDGLALKRGATVLDATLGGGGHSAAICRALEGNVRLIGLDADGAALKRAQKVLGEAGCHEPILRQANFRHLDCVLGEVGIETLDAVVFDLGMSSDQLDSTGGEGRGFSFQRDEPLLMTLTDTPTEGVLTAREIVNEWPQEHIATIIKSYGDERYANRIAEAIATARESAPIATTAQLVEVIESAVPARYRHGRIHPATRTFQALRIAVNDEWEALAEGLAGAFARLAPGGRLAVISFHSLEDRLVKRFMKGKEDEGAGVRVTKKPIPPTDEEIARNPRARSAKLRIIEKTT